MKHPYNVKDMPIGVCEFCNKVQKTLTKGGYWYISSNSVLFWYCFKCQETRKKRYYPTICEQCSYSSIKAMQGGYQCPRCRYFEI